MRKVKAINKRNGKMVFNLAADAANDDWIRAGRLAKKGDAESLAKLAKMEATPMYYRDSKLIPGKPTTKSRSRK